MTDCQLIMSESVRNPDYLDNYPESEAGGYPFTEGDYLDHMGIGEKLRIRRVELRLSVQEVAQRVGLKRQTIYDLENGKQKSSTKLGLICQLYGLNPKWVEFGIGPRLTADAPTGQVGFSPTQSFPSQVSLVGTDQINEGLGMALMARDMLDVVAMLMTVPLPTRTSIIDLIRSVAQAQPPQDAPKPEDFPDPPSTLHITK
jgi:transcriptional regulator with XRE-family HTH domain